MSLVTECKNELFVTSRLLECYANGRLDIDTAAAYTVCAYLDIQPAATL